MNKPCLCVYVLCRLLYSCDRGTSVNATMRGLTTRGSAAKHHCILYRQQSVVAVCGPARAKFQRGPISTLQTATQCVARRVDVSQQHKIKRIGVVPAAVGNGNGNGAAGGKKQNTAKSCRQQSPRASTCLHTAFIVIYRSAVEYAAGMGSIDVMQQIFTLHTCVTCRRGECGHCGVWSCWVHCSNIRSSC